MSTKDVGLPAQRNPVLFRMLHSRRVRWRTAFSYAVVIIVVMTLMTVAILRFFNQRMLATVTARAQTQVAAMADMPELSAAWDDPVALAGLLRAWSTVSGTGLTAFDADGLLLASTNPAHATAEASITPPEVRDALAGELGSSLRVDAATGAATLFTAHAVHADGDVVGVLRLGFPTATVAATQRTLQRMLLIATSLATLAIVGVMVFQAERAARTVRQLTDVAERITGGELGARIISYSSGEIGQLARAFNRMASNLENLLRKSEQETDRLNTVMYAMNDGVLIVNKLGKVELINRGATRLLNTAEANALNQSFVQVVRDHRIVEVWQRSKTSAGQESDIVEGNNSRSLQIVVTPLLRGADRGHLVIMHDLTRIRQLQTIRQDFVSNVSHELRTPLAALRALVETLRDGALEDPPAAQRFLDRMESEVDALTQMVQELLELSRIESGQAPLRLQAVTVAETLRPGVERLRMQAERANIHLSLDLPPGLPQVVVDVDRVQQVVTNLVHNAIKFTPPDGYITVSAAADRPDMVTVAVRDSGVGIPSQDLERIFERFFKADRARAGGGTGLGLAIAKHIIHAHEGEIRVESEQGKGSCFYFTLPQRAAD